MARRRQAGVYPMTTLHGKIVIKDGIVYFASSRPLSTTPAMFTDHYRLSATPEQVQADWPAYNKGGIWDRHVVYAHPPGKDQERYSFRMVQPNGKPPMGIDDVDGAFWTEEPIPCPKVRRGIETRWNGTYGRWEKLLKVGWVPA